MVKFNKQHFTHLLFFLWVTSYEYALLHHLILGTTSTLWHSPVNIFMWHLNRTALAVNTVLRVDNQLLVYILINPCWAKSRLWGCIHLKANAFRNTRHIRFDFKMRRLIILMIGATALQVCQQIKSQFSIRWRIIDGLKFVGRLC